MSKTNVIRILDQKKISYETFTYDISDGFIDGVSVANKIGENPEKVFKTLVCRGKSGRLFVFLVPVSSELNLKLAAEKIEEKSLSLIQVKYLKKITGYIKGGCSPIGMKKLFPTFIDFSAKQFKRIIISAGTRGIQVSISPDDLKLIISAEYADLKE